MGHVVTSGFLLALFLFIASVSIWRKLPMCVRKLIIRFPLAVELFASVGIYIVLGLSIIAHMAAAMYAGMIILTFWVIKSAILMGGQDKAKANEGHNQAK